MQDNDYGIFGKGLEGYVNYIDSIDYTIELSERSGTGGERQSNGSIPWWAWGLIIYGILSTIFSAR